MSLPEPDLHPEFYADLPLKRVSAWGIDLLITLALTLLAVVLTAFLAAFFLPVLFTVISVAYRTLMLARYGATFGMAVMALDWRRLDGTRPDAMVAFVYACAHAGQWIVLPLQIVSMVMIVLTPYRQGLHDTVLGTTILRRAA